MSRADILKINWDIARARVDQLESQVRDLTNSHSEKVVRKLNEDVAQFRADCIRLSAEVRDLTLLKDEIDRMRFSAESEVDQQDKEIERLHAAGETAEKEHRRIVCKWQDLIHMPQNALVAQFESENAGLRDNVERLEQELKEARK